MKSISWKRKSREKLLKEGNKNTKFFHYLANHRRRSNYVEKLCLDGDIISGNEELREIAKVFNQNLYTEDFSLRPKLDSLYFDTIDNANRKLLEVKLAEDEILLAFKSCNGDKEPGPDGFNFKFLLNFWSLLKEYMINLFMTI